MSSLSLALPWQQELWQRLGQQYAEGRLAHAQLYSGSTGIGKHVFAEAMAVLLLCQNASGSKLPGVTACGQCRSCELLKHGYHPDLMRVAVEEGSRVIKIEQVRAITEFVTKTSHSDGAKVIVIRDVELLNTSSANALLKTLEEPSANCYLLLLSPNPGRLMATIRSRCQRIDFATPSIEQSKDWLQLQGIASDQSDALLGLAKGHPLLARDLSKSDLLQQRDKVLNAVVGILEKKQSPQTLMQLSKAIEIKTIVAAMSDLCADLVKSALSARGPLKGQRPSRKPLFLRLLPSPLN